MVCIHPVGISALDAYLTGLLNLMMFVWTICKSCRTIGSYFLFLQNIMCYASNSMY